MHRSLLRSPSAGLFAVLLVLGTVLTVVAGSHVDPVSGSTVSNFLNAHTLLQMGTDASGFAIMGVGATSRSSPAGSISPLDQCMPSPVL